MVDRIIELTDRKPYLIQKLCVALVNRLHEEKRRQITIADVDAVAGEGGLNHDDQSLRRRPVGPRRAVLRPGRV